jgi:virulence surface antigen
VPYYYVDCTASGCTEKLRAGETRPSQDVIFTCKRGHKVSLSQKYGVKCPCGEMAVFSSPFGATETATCARCNQKFGVSLMYQVTCPRCRRMEVSARAPTGTQFLECDCGEKLGSGLTWRTVPTGVRFDVAVGRLTSQQTEYETLTTAGLTLVEGGRFKQSERIPKVRDFNARTVDGEKAAKNVEAGICEGQCLHWIRRVLQGGRLDYDTSRDKRNVARSSTDADERLVRQANAAGELQRLNKEMGLRYSQWEAYAQEADRKISDAKGKSVGAMTRRFANIRISKHLTDKVWGSIDEYLRTLFQEDAFTTPTVSAAVLGLGVIGTGEDKKTSISGHAIAVFRDRRRALYNLFDPNYGVFSAPDMERLRAGTLALITRVWTSYGTNPWQLTMECGYTVFEAIVQSTPAPSTPQASTHEARILVSQGNLSGRSSPPPPTVEIELAPVTLAPPPRKPPQSHGSSGQGTSSGQSSSAGKPSGQQTRQPPPSQTQTQPSGGGLKNLKSFWENQGKK